MMISMRSIRVNPVQWIAPVHLLLLIMIRDQIECEHPGLPHLLDRLVATGLVRLTVRKRKRALDYRITKAGRKLLKREGQ